MIQENTPAKVGLLELLLASSGVQFVIPAYQRNYTWTANREVKQRLHEHHYHQSQLPSHYPQE